MCFCQWHRYSTSHKDKKKSLDDDEISTIIPYKSDVLFHTNKPILNPTSFEYATDIGTQTLHIGQVNNAKITAPAYAQKILSAERAIMNRYGEDRPFTIQTEYEYTAPTGTFSYAPIVSNGRETGFGVDNTGKLRIYMVFYDYATGGPFRTITTLGFSVAPVLQEGQRYLITFTYNGDKTSSVPARIWLNGVEHYTTNRPTTTVTAVSEFQATTNSIFVSGGSTAVQRTAIGRISVWNKVLTDEQISACSFECEEESKIVDLIATTGGSATIYSTLPGDNANATIINATLSSVWGTQSDTLCPWNELQGFTLFQNNTDSSYIRVPYKNDGTPNISSLSGYTKISEHPAGAWWNNSEAKFKFNDELVGSDMMNSDIDNVFFESDGTAKWFDLNEVYSSNRGYWYLNVLDTKTKKQFTVYKTDKVNQQDVKVLKWHKMGALIERDESGAVVFDEDGHANLMEE